MPDEQSGGQGEQGGQGGKDSDARDDFELDSQRRSRDPDIIRKSAPDVGQAPPEPDGSQTGPGTDDRDDFELVDLTEKEPRGSR